MKNKLGLLTSLAIALTAPTSGVADTFALHDFDQRFELAQNRSAIDVIAGLEAQGYTVRAVGKTFLGRTRVVASNAFHTREVVMSTTTGEILSDTVSEVKQPTPSPTIKFEGSITLGINFPPRDE